METRTKGFKRSLLATSIASMLVAPSLVQAQDESLEEILVTGVYASQLNAVNTKRDAASVVDAISAEDIGKLPDVTIADSLQRVPGIQVERTAGEGGPVQIRGLGNVATSLNGETFLSATTIDSSGADFGDLPSQLFSGAEVYKSPLATLTTLGISGTVDLKTRRPFDLDEGWTFSASGEVDQGSISEEADPTVSGLVGWTNDKLGFLVSAVTTEKNLASDFNGWNDTSENGGNLGWHNNNHTYWGIGPATPYDFHYTVPHGVTAFSKAEERHRDGLNLSFQANVTDSVELVVDHFYSKQERWNRRAGFNHNSRWQGFNHYALPVEEGLTRDRFSGWATTTMYDLNPYRMQSFTQTNYNLEESNNTSAELNFDNGGALTGQVRLTRADAEARMRHGYIEGDLLSVDQGSLVTGPGGLRPAEDCTGDNAIPGEPVGENGGCFIQYSPNGIETDDFQIRYDASGEHPVFSGFDQTVDGGLGEQSVADYMADISAYHVGAGSSEGNTDDEATMNTFSTQWNYAFDDQPLGISSIDIGMRQSERFVDHKMFSYFAEFEDTGCQAQWKAVDQFAGTEECDSDLPQGEYLVDENGDPVLNEDGDQVFANYTLIPPMTLDENADVIWVDDFGPVSGIPGVWAVDPRELDDTLAFQERVFGEQTKFEQPGQTYSIGLNELSYFSQINFNYDDFVTGNLGVKIIETDLTVVQNEVGGAVPHSGVAYDTGDVVTRRSYTDVLPSLNVALNATDDVILRLGYGETMQPLNLMDWGGAKRVGRTFNDDCECMRVVDGSLNGNPELDPTRAKNYDLSAEWYLGEASMLSTAVYRIEIDSFTTTETIMLDEPDSDGIRRGPWPFSALVQGTGGEVNGVEVAAKVAFSDLTDGFLSNFGFDVNYTLSESSQDATGLEGKELPFPSNSEDTYNVVGWFENDRLSARLAYNFRSPRLIAAGGAPLARQALYQDDYGQLDLNVTYDVTDQWSLYLNGSNINEEYQDTYLEFKDQKVFQNIYEARWALGARFTY